MLVVLFVALAFCALSLVVGYASRDCPSGLHLIDTGQELLMFGMFEKAKQGRTFVITLKADRYEVYPRKDGAILVRRLK